MTAEQRIILQEAKVERMLICISIAAWFQSASLKRLLTGSRNTYKKKTQAGIAGCVSKRIKAIILLFFYLLLKLRQDQVQQEALMLPT